MRRSDDEFPEMISRDTSAVVGIVTLVCSQAVCVVKAEYVSGVASALAEVKPLQNHFGCKATPGSDAPVVLSAAIEILQRRP